jgi:hypothetical protein
MTKQIAPCPFCGEASDWDAAQSGEYFVACVTPGCGLGPLAKTKNAAIAAWNRLAAAVKMAEVAGELLEIVEAKFGPLPDDWCVAPTIGTTRGPITVGMIRDAAPPAEKENGND